jgi:hypothetical protein
MDSTSDFDRSVGLDKKCCHFRRHFEIGHYFRRSLGVPLQPSPAELTWRYLSRGEFDAVNCTESYPEICVVDIKFWIGGVVDQSGRSKVGRELIRVKGRGEKEYRNQETGGINRLKLEFNGSEINLHWLWHGESASWLAAINPCCESLSST